MLLNDYDPCNILIAEELKHLNGVENTQMLLTKKPWNKESAKKTEKNQETLHINEEKLKCTLRTFILSTQHFKYLLNFDKHE